MTCMNRYCCLIDGYSVLHTTGRDSNTKRSQIPLRLKSLPREMSVQVSPNASSKVMTDVKIYALFQCCIMFSVRCNSTQNDRANKYIFFKTGKSKYAGERYLALGYTIQGLNLQ